MNEDSYILDFSIEDVYLLYDCVCKRIESWEGTPKNHPFEQEHLHQLKDWLYRCILDYKFHEM
jgi:hypothetical protein